MTWLGVESFEDKMQNFNRKGMYSAFFTTDYHEKGDEGTYSMKHQEEQHASLKWELLLSSASETCCVATIAPDGSGDSRMT